MSLDWRSIKNFRQAEFDSPDEPGSGAKMDATFVRLLDELRDRVGFPLVLTSAYRSPAHNASLEHSVDGSAHTLGLAVDIAARSSSERFIIVRNALELGVRRIGIGRTFIHLDVDRSKPANVVWLYS